MHAVHFWGQERSYLPDQIVSNLWLKEKWRERGIWASALGWNMDMQGIFRFAVYKPFCILDITLRTLNTWDTLHVMNYIIFLYFCPCRDLISIIQSWICHVWTVYIMGVGVDHVFESHIVHFSCVSMLSCSCGLSFWHLKQNVSLSFEPVANVAMYIFREKGWNPPYLHFSPPLIHYHV